MSQIPLVDLKAQHQEVAREVAEGFSRICENTAFILGEEVAAFEREYAAFVGSKQVIGVANGTDALELAVRALGLGPTDEVVVPTNSFIASALAVARAGAKVVLCDCDEDGLVTRRQLEARLSAATRALMPVHLFGQCAPMKDVLALARDQGLEVIEDAAQAQGAAQDGKSAGSFARLSGTSFYPGKNLGAYGDAGAVLTSDEALAAKVRALRNYGSEVKYHHPELGFNSRMDPLQAVVLRAKLKRLAGYNARRRAAAERYHALLRDMPDVRLPREVPGNHHIWHIYAVRVPRRDQVLKALNQEGIGAGVHYPVPIHLQGAFKSLGHRKGDFPVAEKMADEMLSLPLYPELTAEKQEKVVQGLRKALAA